MHLSSLICASAPQLKFVPVASLTRCSYTVIKYFEIFYDIDYQLSIKMCGFSINRSVYFNLSKYKKRSAFFD